MSITKELLNNSCDVKAAQAITLGMTYTYEDLVDNIKEYQTILAEYKNKNINKIGIITKEEFDFNTISLIFAMMQLEIVPVIINSSINERIKGILEKEGITIALYDTLIKPSYLKKIDILIEKELQYYASINPYANVRDKKKIKDLKKYMANMKSEKQESFVVCKLYDRQEESIITKTEITEYGKNFSDLKYGGKWEDAITTLPLYNKAGFLYLTRALSNDMHVRYLNKADAEKNVIKILKKKPKVISIDKYMAEQLIYNENYKNIDLSFLEKVVIDTKIEEMSLIDKVLEKCGFKGSYSEIKELEKGKIIKKIEV